MARISRVGPNAANMESQGQLDPWGGFRFKLFINDKEVATFMECSGIKSTAEVFEIQEGGLNGHVHKRSSRSKWDNIVLKYATNFDMYLLEWRDQYITDDFSKLMTSTGSIVVLNNDGEELRHFNFVNCWPVGWEGPSLNAMGSELAVETLEIAHEGIYIDSLPPEEPEQPETPETPEPDLAPVQFDHDKADIRPDDKEKLAEHAEYIKQSELKYVYIEGHCSTPGSFAYNLGLAYRRAESIERELKQNGATTNANGETVVYVLKGFSWKYPVASNQTSDGQATNRRGDVKYESFDARGINDGKRYPDSGAPIRDEDAEKRNAPWFHREVPHTNF